MVMTRTVYLKDLLMLFTFAKKKELEKYARTFVMREGDFVDLVLACHQGQLPFKHGVHYRRTAPKDLPDPPGNVAAGAGGAPVLDVKRLKVLWNRLQHESTWGAAHLFYTENFYEWHLFIFDHHDQAQHRGNHWVFGAHMHFVNWLWPRLDPEKVWNDFVLSGKKPGSSLHLRDESSAA